MSDGVSPSPKGGRGRSRLGPRLNPPLLNYSNRFSKTKKITCTRICSGGYRIFKRGVTANPTRTEGSRLTVEFYALVN